MSTYKNRGHATGFAQFTPTSFWTNQVFGHSINGVDTPSLNVGVNDTALHTEVSFSHVGDSGDEGKPFVSAKDQFIAFMTHPDVTDEANRLITEKHGALTQLQLSIFIEEHTKHLPPRPRATRKATMNKPLGNGASPTL